MSWISLHDAHVDLPVYGADSKSLRSHLFGIASGGRIHCGPSKMVVVNALKAINLHFSQGDRVGLIGRNGAGKTTLLKLLAGIYEPAQGSVDWEGRISPLLKPDFGIDLDATGYETVRFGGLFLGLSLNQSEKLIPWVEEFTELGDYLSMPVRSYSAGMRARLMFAVSTLIDPDILLIDEWFGAGDRQFLQKAQKRMLELVQKSSILVFASHSEEMLRQICNKGLLLDQGTVHTFADIDEALRVYSSLS